MNATTERPGAGRDPAELEREASQIRADMDRTLDALERRFSPSQLLDRSLTYLREHGGELTRNVGDVVKNNPVPIVLTVGSIAWLIASQVRAQSQATSQDDSFGDESPYADRATGQTQWTAGSRLHQRVEATRERIRSSREAAANKLSEAADATLERTRRAQYQVESLVKERPLLWGGMAVALGALIGAAIPATDYENRTVGQVRDRAVKKAKQVGEREYENLRSKLETHHDLEVSGTQAH